MRKGFDSECTTRVTPRETWTAEVLAWPVGVPVPFSKRIGNVMLYGKKNVKGHDLYAASPPPPSRARRRAPAS